MPKFCRTSECKVWVPAALESEGLCVQHFILAVERVCAEMRRETVIAHTPHERHVEITRFISEQGELLARVATTGLSLTDDTKARILNTFLTLMNLRENLDRAALRQPVGRSESR
jgi:hypothetical protein